MAAGGKGSRQRQAVVPDDVVANNWELAFGKKAPQKTEKQIELDQSIEVVRDILVHDVISEEVLDALFLLMHLGLGTAQKLFQEIGQIDDESLKKLLVVVFSLNAMGMESNKPSILAMLDTITSQK